VTSRQTSWPPARPQLKRQKLIYLCCLLPEEDPTTAHIGLDPSSADGPIELDLERMDINVIDVAVSLLGDGPPNESRNDIPTVNPFDNTMTAWGNNISPPFDATIDMDNIDISVE
jgi:hypothetical protein